MTNPQYPGLREAAEAVSLSAMNISETETVVSYKAINQLRAALTASPPVGEGLTGQKLQKAFADADLYGPHEAPTWEDFSDDGKALYERVAAALSSPPVSGWRDANGFSVRMHIQNAISALRPFAVLVEEAEAEEELPEHSSVHMMIMGDGELGDLPVSDFTFAAGMHQQLVEALAALPEPPTARSADQ